MKIKELKIRKAVKRDVEGISRLIGLVVDYHCEFDEYYKPLSKYKNIGKSIERSLKNKDMIILVAEVGNKIIGYYDGGVQNSSGYVIPEKIGYIYTTMVDKNYSGKGLGQKMFKELLEEFKKRKIKNIELEVDSRNKQGIKFWKKSGFFTYRYMMRLDL